MTLNCVLCAVDFSEPSRRALHHARAIATWYEAPLHVLNVFSGTMPLALPSLAALPPMAGGGFRPAMERALEAFTSEIGAATRVVRDGLPAPTILDYAREIHADLIVLGSHGWSGFDRVLLGSTAERVLHRADCPVLTVPHCADEPGAADRFKLTHILCPMDFSPASLQALERALSLAQESAARLTLLHVVELRPEDPLFVEASLPICEYLADSRNRAIEALEDAVPPGASTWAEIRTLVRHGSPAAVILEEADAGDADLIVMGSQGRHGIGLALFGSTTQTVVRRAACPVLTTKAERSSGLARPLATVGAGALAESSVNDRRLS
jgi:nucleotide-binding universal stress UspA family protein